ncbi:DNA-binding anti-repressor SinI [Cytobacillus sp. FSL K6-0129]
MKLDDEWVELIEEAKAIGITLVEIVEFLKARKPLD